MEWVTVLSWGSPAGLALFFLGFGLFFWGFSRFVSAVAAKSTRDDK